MEVYSNIIEALDGLQKQGYVEDFNLKENCIECRDGQFKVFHNEFVIDKWFRIEGYDSSANDSSIIYAISSEKYGLKGTLINAYGVYSNSITNEMLSKLKFA